MLSWVRPVAKKISSFLRDIPHPTALDVGCAQGFLIETLQQEFGFDVRGLEYAPYAIAGARQSVRERIVNGSVLERDLFPTDCFDAITCFDVLEYLDREQNLEAAATMVHWSRGFIFFTNPYKHSVSGSQKRNPDRLRKTAFTEREYRTIFKNAGAEYVTKFNSGSGGDILVFQKR